MKLAFGAVALALTAGCGATSTPSAERTIDAPFVDTTRPDSTAVLRAAVRAYSDAFLTGRGDAAYAMLSKRCRDRTDRAEFISGVKQAGQLYGSALPFKTFSLDMSATMARVTYTYSVSAINQEAEPWVLEAGAWREDDC